MAHDGVGRRIFQSDRLARVLVGVEPNDLFPIRWHIGVRLFPLESLVRVSLVAADANKVAQVR